MNRKKARDLLFKFLYQANVQKETPENIIEIYRLEKELDDEYVINSFNGVYENLSVIDEKISSNLKGWSMDRISKTVLSVLRLAVYEIIYCNDIPVGVSANEAVELVKTYESEEAASFVNGVLSSIIKEIN